MNSVNGDIQSVGEFMRLYVTRSSRELSPLFIAGESYGTFRAAGLAGYLIDRGLAFNGIVLIGTTLNLETIWSRSDDLVYELELPTYVADAWYHKKVAPEYQKKDLKSFLKEVDFATGEFSLALIRAMHSSRPSARPLQTSLPVTPDSRRSISSRVTFAMTCSISPVNYCGTRS